MPAGVKEKMPSQARLVTLLLAAVQCIPSVISISKYTSSYLMYITLYYEKLT